MKLIVIGTMPQEQLRKHLLAIARGEYKPRESEARVWFTSMRSLADLLSDENRELLKLIRNTQPHTISSLAQMTGRKPGNLSRNLKTMSICGFIEMRRENQHVRPVAKASGFRIVL